MPQKARENIKADGHGFEAKKLHDQVVPRSHEHHSHGGKQQQRVVFAVMFVFDLQVADRKQDDQARSHEKNHPEKQEKRVHHNGAIEAAHRFGAKGAQPIQ